MFLLWGAACMPDSHGDSFPSLTSCMNSPTIAKEMKYFCLARTPASMSPNIISF